MDMEGVLLEQDFTDCNDHSAHIAKGKRTKRCRPWSPVHLVAVTSSTVSIGEDDDDVEGVVGGFCSSFNPSPTTSSDQMDTSVEEDEDMANCLILLAQSGNSCPRRGNIEEEIKPEKVSRTSSRKQIEMTTTAGKAGFFVYECKTCNRTFPSFQALGGHRASHKKPRTSNSQNKINISVEAFTNEVVLLKEHQKHDEEKKKEKDSHSGGKNNSQGNGKQNKIHECSICGSEFTTGQALGGHMRRHRAPTNSSIISTRITMINDNNADPSSTSQYRRQADHQDQSIRKNNILGVDLNLPAPEDDHGDSSSNLQMIASSQQHLVFSGPALVDCHY